MLARGEPPPGRSRNDAAHRRTDWPDDLSEVVYIDHFGNAMTGLRAVTLPPDAKLGVAGQLLQRAGTFSDRPVGTGFWYENSNGLVEIAVNSGTRGPQSRSRDWQPSRDDPVTESAASARQGKAMTTISFCSQPGRLLIRCRRGLPPTGAPDFIPAEHDDCRRDPVSRSPPRSGLPRISRQAVEPGDHKHVAFAQRSDGLPQLRSVTARATLLLREQLRRSRRLKLSNLGRRASGRRSTPGNNRRSQACCNSTFA
jgi:hypothetical protein